MFVEVIHSVVKLHEMAMLHNKNYSEKSKISKIPDPFPKARIVGIESVQFTLVDLIRLLVEYIAITCYCCELQNDAPVSVLVYHPPVVCILHGVLFITVTKKPNLTLTFNLTFCTVHSFL